MLHDFLTLNRAELVRRCRDNETKRSTPMNASQAANHGVPMFLEQLVETLRHRSLALAESFGKEDPAPVPPNIGRAAALYGAEMLRRGCTVDQVVRDYGDVCQIVTQMAIEQKSFITIDEFRTLNRCLDDAIADAVTAFARDRQVAHEHPTAIQDRLESISEHVARYASSRLRRPARH